MYGSAGRACFVKLENAEYKVQASVHTYRLWCCLTVGDAVALDSVTSALQQVTDRLQRIRRWQCETYSLSLLYGWWHYVDMTEA